MKENDPNRHRRAPRIAAVVGVFVSALVAAYLYRYDASRVREAFRREVDGYAAAIEREISQEIAILMSLRGLFDASEDVTRSEFHTFSDVLLTQYPAVRAVGWVPRVSAAEREQIEQTARDEGCAGFQLTERKTQGGMIPAAARAEYYPVLYMEPLAGNEAGLSFDLASDPIRRAAIHSARDSGEPCVSGRIQLVQDTGENWAVLFLLPVYAGRPETVEGRRAAMRGVISGVFRFAEILAAASAQALPDERISLTLVDRSGGVDGDVLHAAPPTRSRLIPNQRYDRPLTLHGERDWALIGIPTAAYLSGQRSITPAISLIIGLLATGWLFAYLSKMFQQRQRVEELVALRTRELQTQTTALAESNDRLRREIEDRRELQQRFADAVDHEQRRLGQELHDALGQQIAVTTLLARSLKKMLGAAEPAARDLADKLCDSSRVAQLQVRALSKGLLPVDVKPGGLQEALRELAAGVRGASDSEILYTCQKTAVVRDGAAATHLYRIAQEALRNAMEHGRGSRITIDLSGDDSAVTLTVQDDGRGFNLAGRAAAGSGLATMRYRAGLIGADLRVTSGEKEGATVVCRLPQTPAGSAPSE